MIPVPYQKLHFFREKIGLDEKDYKTIEPFKKVFVQAKDRFSQIQGIANLVAHAVRRYAYLGDQRVGGPRVQLAAPDHVRQPAR